MQKSGYRTFDDVIASVQVSGLYYIVRAFKTWRAYRVDLWESVSGARSRVNFREEGNVWVRGYGWVNGHSSLIVGNGYLYRVSLLADRREAGVLT